MQQNSPAHGLINADGHRLEDDLMCMYNVIA